MGGLRGLGISRGGDWSSGAGEVGRAEEVDGVAEGNAAEEKVEGVEELDDVNQDVDEEEGRGMRVGECGGVGEGDGGGVGGSVTWDIAEARERDSTRDGSDQSDGQEGEQLVDGHAGEKYVLVLSEW